MVDVANASNIQISTRALATCRAEFATLCMNTLVGFMLLCYILSNFDTSIRRLNFHCFINLF